MKLKQILLGITIGIIIVGILLSGFIIGRNTKNKSQNLSGLESFKAFSSVSTTSVWTIGPDIDTTVLATTSRRLYARFQVVGDGALPAYLSIRADNPAINGVGIRLWSTSTPFEINQWNLYTGAVHARSIATTTLLMIEAVY